MCRPQAKRQKEAAAQAKSKAKRARTEAYERARREMEENVAHTTATFEKAVQDAEQTVLGHLIKAKETLTAFLRDAAALDAESTAAHKQVKRSRAKLAMGVDDFRATGDRIVDTFDTKMNKLIERVERELSAEVERSLPLDGVLAELRKLSGQIEAELPADVLAA
jgi:molecular chaperone GrpE (heat shock protein)